MLLVSACSMVYELMLAQVLSTLFGHSVVRYSTTIGTYICALGIGALVFDSWKPERVAQKFVWLELILAFLGLTSPFLAFGFDAALTSLDVDFTWRLIAGHGLVCVIGLLSGIELPMLLKMAGPRQSSRIIGADFLGTCVGSVLFPLMLYPQLGLIGTAVFAAAANVLAAIYFFDRQHRLAWAIALPILFMPFVYLYFSGAETQLVTTFYRKFWL
jgi:spermidine synthase